MTQKSDMSSRQCESIPMCFERHIAVFHPRKADAACSDSLALEACRIVCLSAGLEGIMG